MLIITSIVYEHVSVILIACFIFACRTTRMFRISQVRPISMFRCKSQLEEQNFGLVPRLKKSSMLSSILESTTECSLIIESLFLLLSALKYCQAKVCSYCVFGVESPVGLSIS